MKNIKFSVVGLLLIGLFLGFLYSKKYYISDRQVQCTTNKSLVAEIPSGEKEFIVDNVIASKFDNWDYPIFARERNYRYKCELSFRVHNLASTSIDIRYRVKDMETKPESTFTEGVNFPRARISYRFIDTGLIKLKPNKARLVTLVHETNQRYRHIKVDSWLND